MRKFQLATLSISLFLVIGFLLLSTNFSTEPLPVPEQQRNEYEAILLQQDLAAKMEQYGVPGISFAVVRKGQLDWAKGYGVLQKRGEEKVNKETIFSVGSVSKVGTAVMILKLPEPF